MLRLLVALIEKGLSQSGDGERVRFEVRAAALGGCVSSNVLVSARSAIGVRTIVSSATSVFDV